MIYDGETIILDAGTTVAQIARNIKNKRDLTVITNAVNVALELANCRDIVTIVTGGIIREITNCLVGFPAEKFLKEEERRLPNKSDVWQREKLKIRPEGR